MQTIELYIEGQRVDMFKDESVTITQSIKNVKDIDKIFTSFSKTFSLPASKINNKIFKHYYNFDIVGGFDARIRKASNIELNNLPFTDGLIKLEGVDLKNNKPHTYKITFFGNTVTLKDTLGDDKLSGLTSLTNLNKTYGIAGFLVETTTSSTNLYRVSIRRDGVEVANSGDITSGNLGGGKNSTGVLLSEIQKDSAYTIYIQSNFVLTFSAIDFKVFRIIPNQSIPNKIYSIGSYQYTPALEFDITQQIPDIKVIDFLSGLFKMFNLVADIERNETEIKVKTLDDFYANPSASSPYDITKYIDVNKSQVNIALPFRKINFRHEDTKTFLAAKHTQLFGETWGEAQFDFGEKLDGSIYNVETPFAQMKYERLIDANTSLVTTAQWGWSVDDNQEPHLGKPLLFYPIKITNGNNIAFLNSPNSQIGITDYNIPSNSVSLSSATSSYNMNFNAEQNEWGALENPADIGFTNSLFEAYYKNYITSVFNPSNRITKVTAYLPLKILLNYTLADRFIIGGHSYKINSITTNLENGKSELELLNDL
jgi:hypothetical protein